MFKILLLRRSSAPDTLYSFATDTENDPPEKVVFETDDEDELVKKMQELLETIPRNQIKPIRDIDWEIDILLKAFL